MTKATSKTSTKSTAVTSELATANNAAITVQATSPAPIVVDVSSAWDSFSVRPGVAASLFALSKTKDGFMYIWEAEQEEQFGQSVVVFFWQIFKAVALPLLSLIWLAVNKAYVWLIAPQTRAATSEKWAELQNWLAPKFNYSRTADEQLSSIEK